MSLSYDVVVNYSETGNIGGKLGDLNKKLGSGVDGMLGNLSSGLEDVADSIGSIGKMFVGIGAAGAMALGGMGAAAVKLNSDLENTHISLAAIFQANGASSSFAGGMTEASKQITKMRKDAADLPGEFTDLVNIFQTIAPNTFRAGLGTDATRKMAAQTMTMAEIMRIPQNVAAREMSALIEGRSGSHNILGLRMMGLAGDKAKTFNSKTEAERVKLLTTEMNKYDDAVTAFRTSFTGQFSTMKDNLKQFAIDSGKPLFEHVKKSLIGINDWFNTHQGTVAVWANRIGTAFADAWDFAANAFEKYAGPVTTFVSQLMGEIGSVWTTISPMISAVGDSFVKSLSNGEAVENLKTMARLYLAMKIGGPLISGVGGPLLGSMGKAAMGMGEGSGIAGLAVGAGAAVVALGALTAAFGESSALINKDSQYHADAVVAMTEFEESTKRLSNVFNSTLMPAIEGFGTKVAKFAADVLQSATRDLDSDEELEKKRIAMNGVNGGMGDRWLLQWHKDHPKLGPTDDVPINRDNTPLDFEMSKHAAAAFYAEKNKNDPNAGHKVPHTVINNHIEMIIQTNQDPLRVARLTVDELAKMARNPKSSPRTNFMANR